MKKFIHPKRNRLKIVLSSGESYTTLSCINSDNLYLHVDNRNHELWTKSTSQKLNTTSKKNDFKFFDSLLNG
jgi:ribosomal protein L31